MYAYFLAKIDVSGVEIAHLQECLPMLARLLESRGDGTYQIDYTQDFSGVVDRKALVDHLQANGFEIQGPGILSGKGAILDNTSSVGDYVCTWLHEARGHTARTKIYNKVVSQFEAGEVFGGHLADYVDRPNQHMRRTFERPAVQARGCTRVKGSYYGSEALSAQTGEELVAAALEEVQLENEKNGLFVVQPPTRQWENLAWPGISSGQTKQKGPRSGGCLGKADTVGNGRLRLSQLSYLPSRSFGCGKQRSTVLGAALLLQGRANNPGGKPKALPAAPRGSSPQNAPTTNRARGVGLARREDVGNRKAHRPSCPLWKIPEIAANRKLSTLSRRNRAARLEEIFEEKTKLEWVEKLEKIAKKRGETRELRSKEIEQMRGIVEAKKRLLAERAKIRDAVECALFEPKTKKLREISGKPWKVLGHREATFGPRVVLEDEEGGTEVVYSTKQLAKLLENTRELFFSEKDRFARELFFAASQKQKLEIQVLLTRSFFNAEGKEIFWNPIGIDKYPDPQKLEELQREQRNAREFLAEHGLDDFQLEKLHACTLPKPKDWKKAIDMESGKDGSLPPSGWRRRGAHPRLR